MSQLVHVLWLVNFAVNFFPLDLRPASREGHKSTQKDSVHNLQYGPGTELVGGIYQVIIIIIIIMVIVVISLNDVIKQTGNYSTLHVVTITVGPIHHKGVQ